MKSPFFYDLKRTITSKTVLIGMAALMLLSLAVISNFAASATPPNNTSTSQIFVYYDSGGYHFLGFAWNQFGQPVSGTKFQVNITVPTLSPDVVSESGTTNSVGSSQFTVKVPENNSYAISVVVTSPSLVVDPASGTYTPFSSSTLPNQTVPVFVGGFAAATPTTVIDSTNASARNILVSYAGAGNSPPIGYQVYYKFINGSVTTSCTSNLIGQSCSARGNQNPIPSQFNQTNSQLLGTMHSYLQTFQAPEPEANIVNGLIVVGLAYSNGTSIPVSNSYIGFSQLYPHSGTLSGAQGNQIVVSFLERIFGLFIPLLAIVGTYNIYGKDRVSGVLESVLAQPITRRSLSLSRYLSNFGGMSVAILASVSMLDLIAQHFTKSFLSSTILLSSTGALLVELAAFIGIMMLISHLVKSSGALIGIGVGLFLVIDFFLGLIVTLLASSFGIQSGSVAFYQLSVGLEFVNPAQFISLVGTYLTNVETFVGLGGVSFPITPASYGITIPTIFVTGVIWISVPFICFLYLAIRRD